MLVLTRKNRETVVIGGSDTSQPLLTITVLEIAPGRVRLGFQADALVPIHREEVWQRLRADSRPPGPV
jgi:carbon storage regulator CsrA